jgi:hypothetical protein
MGRANIDVTQFPARAARKSERMAVTQTIQAVTNAAQMSEKQFGGVDALR